MVVVSRSTIWCGGNQRGSRRSSRVSRLAWAHELERAQPLVRRERQHVADRRRNRGSVRESSLHAASRRLARLHQVPDDRALLLDQLPDAEIREIEQRISASRPNGIASAVPWTSMNRPSPVLTMFMSTSARLSSS